MQEEKLEQIDYSEQDLKPYLVDKLGNKYFFDKPITRKFRLEVISILAKLRETQTSQDIATQSELIDNIMIKLLNYNYPELIEEEVNSILDASYDAYGLEGYIEACGIVIESVFQKAGAKQNSQIPTFVLAHRKMKN